MVTYRALCGRRCRSGSRLRAECSSRSQVTGPAGHSATLSQGRSRDLWPAHMCVCSLNPTSGPTSGVWLCTRAFLPISACLWPRDTSALPSGLFRATRGPTDPGTSERWPPWTRALAMLPHDPRSSIRSHGAHWLPPHVPWCPGVLTAPVGIAPRLSLVL